MVPSALVPNVETLGYCQESLRDEDDLRAISATVPTLPSSLQHRFGMPSRRFGLASQHSRQLGDAFVCFEQRELRNRTATFHLLCREEVRRGWRGHLRQVRNAQHLTLLGNLSHFLGDGIGCLTTHICIHLIKDQRGNLVHDRQHSLERKHHTGQLSRGCDGAQRPSWFAWVGRELEFNRIETMLRASCSRLRELFFGHRSQQYIKAALPKTEVSQLFRD